MKVKRYIVDLVDDGSLAFKLSEEELLMNWNADEVEDSDYISREAVMYFIRSYIHEIITESGTDKNERTNRILRSILNGIETMPPIAEEGDEE